MSTQLSALAEQLNISPKELKEKIAELGFDISPRARVLDDDIAELVLDELTDNTEESDEVGDIYDEIISKQREREIVKSQRKRKASSGEKKSSAKPGYTSVVRDDVIKSIEIGDEISVKEYAEKTGINIAKIIGELMKNGILANINQMIDFETAQVISSDLNVKVTRTRSAALAEEFLGGDISNLLIEDDNSLLEERPPVVCVMGHVDHGKTKLLDAIRNTDVVAGESGGITQHIGAYQVNKNNRQITFLDTPGHEAFTSMRARGAKVTDLAVLVVAADEGVKPQTIEALNHAKEANVPIIVAINKMDKPAANPEKVMGELAEHGLQPEAWGGDVVMLPVSALKGDGIDQLLELILLTADMENLKANPDREAVGTVIEANLDKGLGPVATILINTGTLKIMNNVIVGKTYGRIKLMKDHHGKPLRIAGPSTPVLIAGLHETPKSGDILQVVKDERTAKLRAAEIKLIEKEKREQKQSGMNQLISHVQSNKILKIILKADTKGSVEAIKQSIAKIKDEDVAVKIIHDGVGTITESDIMMAAASNGVVMGFHSEFFSPNVQRTAEREGVQVKKYSVIYALIEDVKSILTGLLEPELVETIIGRAKVKQIFFSKKKEMILGCGVLSGTLKTGAKLRVVRGTNAEDEENIVGNGMINSIRKVDKVVKSINEGNDCGIKYVGDPDVQEDDVLVAYVQDEVSRIVE